MYPESMFDDLLGIEKNEDKNLKDFTIKNSQDE